MCLFDSSVVEVVARFGFQPVVFAAVVVAVVGVVVELEDLLMIFFSIVGFKMNSYKSYRF